ncbi:hypothetical protein pb186bvf_012842 [Paramecium bursaria]
MGLEKEEDDKINQIILKSSQLLADHKYYEYEQKILTFAFRFINQNKELSALHLYLRASKLLLKEGSTNSGFNLAFKVLELNKADIVSELLSIYSVAPFCEFKLLFINKVLSLYPDQQQQICSSAAIDLINQQRYHLAWRYVIHTDDIKEMEFDFVTRQRLQYFSICINVFNLVLKKSRKLTQGQLNSTKELLKALWPTPTSNVQSFFIHTLIQAIEIQSRQTYEQLYQSFQELLKQDKLFNEVFQTIEIVILQCWCEIFWISTQIERIIEWNIWYVRINVQMISLLWSLGCTRQILQFVKKGILLLIPFGIFFNKNIIPTVTAIIKKY